MTREPYSSMIERAYDRFDAALEHRMAGMIESRNWAHIGLGIAGLPFICVMLLSYAGAMMAGMAIGQVAENTFGASRGLNTAIAMIVALGGWMICLTVMIVRRIHRKNARQLNTGGSP